MTPNSIAEVITALDTIIDRAWNERDRIGYFAALYRRVTRSVGNGITSGRFQDGPLLEKLDVIFARRFLDALLTYQSGGVPSKSWKVAFQACANSQPLIIQQLLMGMNAHINLDLGIASVETSPGAALPQLKPDFDQINALLAEQVGAVESEIASVSPRIGDLEKFGCKTVTGSIVNFNLTVARDAAWGFAERLAIQPRLLADAFIHTQDLAVSVFGISLLNPIACAPLQPIRDAECNDVRQVIDVLVEKASSAASQI